MTHGGAQQQLVRAARHYHALGFEITQNVDRYTNTRQHFSHINNINLKHTHIFQLIPR